MNKPHNFEQTKTLTNKMLEMKTHVEIRKKLFDFARMDLMNRCIAMRKQDRQAQTGRAFPPGDMSRENPVATWNDALNFSRSGASGQMHLEYLKNYDRFTFTSQETARYIISHDAFSPRAMLTFIG